MENAHSVLSPSSGHIWGAEKGCTAHVKMVQMYPEPEDNTAAAEGVASHEVGEQRIRAGVGWSHNPIIEGDIAPNGVVITDEMIENAEIYSTDVLKTYNEMQDKTLVKIGVEDKGFITNIHPECFGTKDCWMYDTVAHVLYIWDYKYGHRFVEVFENIQGILYAAGLIEQLKLSDDCKIVFRIIQPRSYSSEGPIREWSVTVDQLMPHFERLKEKAIEALSDGMTMTTGKHCRDCYPRFACEPALIAGMGLYEVAAKPITHKLSEGAMGLQLNIINRAMKQLKSLKEAFEGQIEATIKQGKGVPGWTLKSTVGREEWIKPIEEVLSLEDLFGLEIKKPTAITPNQARKKGLPEDILKQYAGRNKKGTKLVEDNGLKARKAFSYNETKQ